MLKFTQRTFLNGAVSLLACGCVPESHVGPAQFGTFVQPIESMNGPQLLGTSLAKTLGITESAAETLAITDSASIYHSGSHLHCPLDNCTSTEFDGHIGMLAVRLKIDAVSGMPSFPLYQVSVVSPAPGAWIPLCKAAGQLATVIPGSWNSRADRLLGNPATFSFACAGSAAFHCISLGYDPLSAHYQACTRMIRGDYCGDGMAQARVGGLVDVKDEHSSYDNEGNPDWFFEGSWGINGAICVDLASFGTAAGCFHSDALCQDQPFSDVLLLKNLFHPSFCPEGIPRCDHCAPHAVAGEIECKVPLEDPI